MTVRLLVSIVYCSGYGGCFQGGLFELRLRMRLFLQVSKVVVAHFVFLADVNELAKVL